MKHDITEHSPTHFECQKCHKIWTKTPHYGVLNYNKCSGFVLPEQHNLIKLASNHFECRACHQTWKTSSPRSKCPGLPLYPKYGHEPYLSKPQLGYDGYEIADRHLPEPIGCFQSGGIYVLLYDPAQAVKKQTPRHKRLTMTVTDIFWPSDCLSILDAFIEARASNLDDFRLEGEIAEIAFHLKAFNKDEVEQMGGGCVHIKIAPCLVHTSYSAFQGWNSKRAILVKSIEAAYKKQKAVS